MKSSGDHKGGCPGAVDVSSQTDIWVALELLAKGQDEQSQAIKRMEAMLQELRKSQTSSFEGVMKKLAELRR